MIALALESGENLLRDVEIYLWAFLPGAVFGSLLWLIRNIKQRRESTTGYSSTTSVSLIIFGIVHVLISAAIVLKLLGDSFNVAPDTGLIDVIFFVVLFPCSLAYPAVFTPAGIVIVPLNTIFWVIAIRWIRNRYAD